MVAWNDKLCSPKLLIAGVQFKVVVPGLAPAVGTAFVKLEPVGVVANAIDTFDPIELDAVITSWITVPGTNCLTDPFAGEAAEKTGAGSATTRIVTEDVV